MFLSALLFTIAIFDFTYHKIFNFFNILLFLVGLIFFRSDVNFSAAVITLLVGLILRHLFALGAGDIKLATILTLFFIDGRDISHYWFSVNLIFCLLIIIHIFRNRSVSGDIALAPALCGALLTL